METILAAVITGGLALVGVIITTSASSRRMEQKLAISQAVTDTKLDALTQEVRKHNNFAERIPVLEEKINVANHRIADLEKGEKTI